MENAADALKIAFAVFVFVIAITLTFVVISQAKSTSDTVLYYTDETNFYDYATVDGNNRRVTVSEIIPTIIRYRKENLSVVIKIGNNEKRFNLSEKSGGTTTAIEKELLKYVDDTLMMYKDYYFSETFTEVPILGIYETDPVDGATLTRAAGRNKIYITYEKTNEQI